MVYLARRALLFGAALFALGARAQPEGVLEAAAERILPGARAAKVGRFIEQQLAGSLSYLKPAFDQLARLLELVAQGGWHKGFVELAPGDQDAILARLSRGELPVRGAPQQAMFLALHSLVLEGCLSDPRHGGNDRGIGWRAVGFTPPEHAHHN